MDLKVRPNGNIHVSSQTYITKALRKYELKHGCLKKENTPMSYSIYSRMDKSKLLDETKHQQYQMIIGICQWIVHVGQINILYATAFLSRFSSTLKQNHLKIAEKILGYLKKFPAQTRDQSESADI